MNKKTIILRSLVAVFALAMGVLMVKTVLLHREAGQMLNALGGDFRSSERKNNFAVTATGTFEGIIAPDVNNDVDIGSPILSFKDVYASGTIYSGGSLSLTGTGTSTISGNLAVQGNTRLGDATTDLIDVTGRFSTSLLPNQNNTTDLGAFANAWRDIYASNTLRIGSSTTTLTLDGRDIQFSATASIRSTPTDVASNAALVVNTFNTLSNADLLRLLSNGTTQFSVGPTGNVAASGTLLVTGSGTSTFTNGLQASALNVSSITATSTFANGIQLNGGCFRDSTGSCVGGASGANTALSNLASVAINTALLPNANNTIDLGAFGTAFRDIYASGTLRGSDLVLSGTGTSTSNGGLSVTALASSNSLTVAGSTGTSTLLQRVSVTGISSSGGLTITAGGVILPSASIQDAALSSNVALLDNTQTISGTKTFSGNITLDGSFNTVNNNISIRFGTTNTTDGYLVYRTANTPDTLFLVPGSLSNYVSIVQRGDETTDFARPLQANPTIFIQSSDQTKIFEFGSLAYNALSLTTGVATTTISANSTSTFGGGIAPTSTANNTLDIGGYGSAWRNLFASGTLRASDLVLSGTGTSTISGSFLPNVSNISNLGYPGQAWRDITASGTLRIGTQILASSTSSDSPAYSFTEDGGSSGMTYRIDPQTLSNALYFVVGGNNPSLSVSDSGHVVPGDSNNAFDLGISGTAWRNLYASGTLRVGKIAGSGNSPVLSVCGTTPTIVGSDLSGKITIGSGVTTACTVTFATTFTNAPACVVSGDNTAVTYIATTSATVLTISSSADMASDVISYICLKTIN